MGFLKGSRGYHPGRKSLLESPLNPAEDTIFSALFFHLVGTFWGGGSLLFGSQISFCSTPLILLPGIFVIHQQLRWLVGALVLSSRPEAAGVLAVGLGISAFPVCAMGALTQGVLKISSDANELEF